MGAGDVDGPRPGRRAGAACLPGSATVATASRPGRGYDLAVRGVADLVGESGEPVTIRGLGTPADVPIGRDRLVPVELEFADASDQTRTDTSTGARRYDLAIEPGGATDARLLDGLALEVEAGAPVDLRPGGEEVDMTPRLRLASVCGRHPVARTASRGMDRPPRPDRQGWDPDPSDASHTGKFDACRTSRLTT